MHIHNIGSEKSDGRFKMMEDHFERCVDKAVIPSDIDATKEHLWVIIRENTRHTGETLIKKAQKVAAEFKSDPHINKLWLKIHPGNIMPSGLDYKQMFMKYVMEFAREEERKQAATAQKKLEEANKEAEAAEAAALVDSSPAATEKAKKARTAANRKKGPASPMSDLEIATKGELSPPGFESDASSPCSTSNSAVRQANCRRIGEFSSSTATRPTSMAIPITRRTSPKGRCSTATTRRSAS